jgi:hypothetical protein
LIDCGNGIPGKYMEDVLYKGGNMYWFYYSDVSEASDVSSILFSDRLVYS